MNPCRLLLMIPLSKLSVCDTLSNCPEPAQHTHRLERREGSICSSSCSYPSVSGHPHSNPWCAVPEMCR
ncbi:hypothetical protein AB205_0090760 [Aquarana catesbeiana]|uniref:Secreted protein n=1 Tax=Aquarana catesbeiana TaxID=8400 RepID=A0A2G9RXG7_AQUCT|nr:hypothetical protein AB205_0090760 [Aquarana catesbeiana]